jgi:UDP-glucose 4-epimerase
MKKKILVTGGAGYIGSHVLNQLKMLAEHDVTIIDNLSTGKREAILYGELVVGDVGDDAFLQKILSSQKFEAVIHFAGSVVVPESVSNPLKYYLNNTINSFKLLNACIKHGVNKFIFSSTAAVYGSLEDGIASEETATNPESPYGRTKLMTEWMLQDVAQAHPEFNYVILRYFNVAGASLDGLIGQSTPQATHLLKVACESATGKRPGMQIFGTDYDTKDGTCIRDFIHVDDLARAHVCALNYLAQGNKSVTLNCGYGQGLTVSEMIATTKRLSGVDFKVELAPRRAGDCPVVMSEAKKIREVLGWVPQNNNIDVIVKSALEWEKKLT